MADPVSWLLIEPGWLVAGTDGRVVATVEQVQGDRNSDIFDGLAVRPTQSSRLLYVPSEQVGSIYPARVTLTIADTRTLEPFAVPPPQTTWRPEKPPLTTRISNWLRGRR